MTQITPQPGIMDIALYQGGASHIEGMDRVIKLSSNENPFGPSPKAIAAAQGSLETLHRYPNTDHASLRAAIADVHGLEADRIICGAGSDEILAFLCQGFAGPGDDVLYTEHGFSLYPILARGAGATPVKVRERDRMVDVDALLSACTPRTRIVFVTNPGNPTTTLLDDASLTRIADEIPPHALLVLDGAYAEFANGYDGGAKLVRDRDNVVMTRTFSKLYGLGGLRIGWAYGPQAVIDVLNRLRGPFNLSGTQLVAAEAAMRDRDYAAWCLAENARLRDWLTAGLIDNGIDCDRSQTNFVLARFADAAEADAADAALKARGLIVRKVGGYGLPGCLRITVGDEEACVAVRDALAAFRAKAS